MLIFRRVGYFYWDCLLGTSIGTSIGSLFSILLWLFGKTFFFNLSTKETVEKHANIRVHFY